jgi:hypothetical protein
VDGDDVSHFNINESNVINNNNGNKSKNHYSSSNLYELIRGKIQSTCKNWRKQVKHKKSVILLQNYSTSKRAQEYRFKTKFLTVFFFKLPPPNFGRSKNFLVRRASTQSAIRNPHRRHLLHSFLVLKFV